MAQRRSPAAPRGRGSAARVALCAILGLSALKLCSPAFSPMVGRPAARARGRLGGGARVRAAEGGVKEPRVPVESLEVGQDVVGVVGSSKPYGVFLDIGAEREALVSTAELQDRGLPMSPPEKGTSVRARVLRKEGGKVWATLRSPGLEPVPRRETEKNVEALQDVAADAWLAGEVINLQLGQGALVEVTAPGCSQPSWGLLRVAEFADGLVDTVTVGAQVTVRVASCDVECGSLELSMKEPRVPVESLEVGQDVVGVVGRSKPFGVFLDIGAEREALVSTAELQDRGLPMSPPEKGTSVRARVLMNEGGKVWATLRSPGLEPVPRRETEKNVEALQDVAADAWLAGEVINLRLGQGALVEVTAPGCSQPSWGLLRVAEFADGLVDTVTVGAQVTVRVASCDVERGLLELSMKEDSSEGATAEAAAAA